MTSHFENPQVLREIPADPEKIRSLNTLADVCRDVFATPNTEIVVPIRVDHSGSPIVTVWKYTLLRPHTDFRKSRYELEVRITTQNQQLSTFRRFKSVTEKGFFDTYLTATGGYNNQQANVDKFFYQLKFLWATIDEEWHQTLANELVHPIMRKFFATNPATEVIPLTLKGYTLTEDVPFKKVWLKFFTPAK